MMVSLTSVLGCSSAILRARSRESSIVSPFTSTITSPALTSCLAAGPSSDTLVIMAPLGSFRPTESAMSSVTFWMTTPSQPRSTVPCSCSCCTTSLTSAAGTAKAMPTLPPLGREDRGIHAHDLAIEIEGRAARVAAVHGRIDLQIVVRTGADVAVMGRDDAGRHRAAEAEGVADGQHPVADARILVGEIDVREGLAVGLDLDQGHVGARIGADQGGRKFVAVLERHRDVLGILDHVVIGHHEAIGRDEEARSLRQRRMRLGGRSPPLGCPWRKCLKKS